MRILKNIENIDFIKLTDKDVVRHPLVQSNVKAYEKDDLRKAQKGKDKDG